MSRLLIKKDIVVDKVDGEITIFDVDSSILYSFNQSGSYIFEMIRKGFSGEKIVKNLSKKYDISEKLAKKDVSDFLKHLLKNKIISLSGQRKENR